MNDKEILREKLLEAVTAHFKPNGDIEYRIDKKTFYKIFNEKETTDSSGHEQVSIEDAA